MKSKRIWMRLVAMVLLVYQLAGAVGLPAAAQEHTTLEARIAAFLEKYHISSDQIAISYYNTATQETYALNDMQFMTAGSTYKVMLNMYYYEQQAAGALSSETYVGGVPLAQAHYKSLVESDNDVSEAMIYRIGSFRVYRQTMMEKYGRLSAGETAACYYTSNKCSSRYMLHVLQYLFDNQMQFAEQISYMKQAQPNEYFGKYVTQYEIAHKYGWFEGAVNDVAIVYTPEPYLLVCFTQGVTDAEEILGRLNALVCQYNVQQFIQRQCAAVPVQQVQQMLSGQAVGGIDFTVKWMLQMAAVLSGYSATAAVQP